MQCFLVEFCSWHPIFVRLWNILISLLSINSAMRQVAVTHRPIGFLLRLSQWIWHHFHRCISRWQNCDSLRVSSWVAWNSKYKYPHMGNCDFFFFQTRSILFPSNTHPHVPAKYSPNEVWHLYGPFWPMSVQSYLLLTSNWPNVTKVQVVILNLYYSPSSLSAALVPGWMAMVGGRKKNPPWQWPGASLDSRSWEHLASNVHERCLAFGGESSGALEAVAGLRNVEVRFPSAATVHCDGGTLTLPVRHLSCHSSWAAERC